MEILSRSLFPVGPDAKFDDEVEEYGDAFQLFDKDGDGIINSKDLAAVLQSIGYNPSQEDLKAMIQAVDQDNRGTIDFKAFCDMMKMKRKPMLSSATALELFRFFDSDFNGLITRAELEKAMQAVGEQLNENDVDEMMQLADSDGDGMLDFHDFMRIISAHDVKG